MKILHPILIIYGFLNHQVKQTFLERLSLNYFMQSKQNTHTYTHTLT